MLANRGGDILTTGQTVYNYSKLLGRIRECGYTQATVAQAIGIAPISMHFKLSNRREFKRAEMEQLAKVLKIPCKDFSSYFFCEKSSEV